MFFPCPHIEDSKRRDDMWSDSYYDDPQEDFRSELPLLISVDSNPTHWAKIFASLEIKATLHSELKFKTTGPKRREQLAVRSYIYTYYKTKSSATSVCLSAGDKLENY